MNTEKSFSENYINNITEEIDQKYRETFKDLIIEAKRLTHQCQYECYDKIKKDLLAAENCARECFMPMIYIKKNIAKLIENCKEDLEKCKFFASSNNNDGKYENYKIKRCIKLYEEELHKTKDEAEYIYAGYLKNYPDLMANINKNSIDSFNTDTNKM